MTSLLGRLLPLFAGSRRVEDLFTEAVAQLFERRPDLCLSWLDDLDLIRSVSGEDQRYIRVTTQKSFVALDEHGSGSRPDLIVEVQHAVENAELESSVDVVMVESKIGSVEGEDQLIRYAGHLSDMSGTKKSLVYITRAYDPKGKKEILSSIDENICFEQLRWHDFYRFLQTVDLQERAPELALACGMKYTAIFEHGEDGWWVGSCLEMPEAITQGETIEEARENLKDAIQLLLEVCDNGCEH